MRRLLFATAAFALVAGAAHADTLRFSAALNGASEVPPNTTNGTGQMTATLDTVSKVFKYTLTFKDLTGAATAAHFHGPAEPGKNAPPVVPIMNPSSPVSGQATLTDAQIADLKSGKWYVNVHTMAHPPGEIRGQVMTTP
jgi:hypothetical protein